MYWRNHWFCTQLDEYSWLLESQTFPAYRNCDFQMERYVWRRRPDGESPPPLPCHYVAKLNLGWGLTLGSFESRIVKAQWDDCTLRRFSFEPKFCPSTHLCCFIDLQACSLCANFFGYVGLLLTSSSLFLQEYSLSTCPRPGTNWCSLRALSLLLRTLRISLFSLLVPTASVPCWNLHSILDPRRSQVATPPGPTLTRFRTISRSLAFWSWRTLVLTTRYVLRRRI